MGIKRGVSLYSYQQTQFFKQMDWKDMVREFMIIYTPTEQRSLTKATICDYPFPSEQFIFDWNNYIARYEMKPVTMDIYLDVHQFRDHIMNHREAAERLKNDIKLAARLGFQNVRPLCLVPIDVIEMALDTAENTMSELEKRSTLHFRSDQEQENTNQRYGQLHLISDVRTDYDLAQRTGSKHVGLVPDFGIFQHSPSQVAIDYVKRHAEIPEAVDFILHTVKNMIWMI